MSERADLRLPRGITRRLLTCDEAAAYCNVVAETFEKYVRPHVPPVEIGARVLWDIKALDRWLDEQSGLVDAPRPLDEWIGVLGR